MAVSAKIVLRSVTWLTRRNARVKCPFLSIYGRPNQLKKHCIMRQIAPANRLIVVGKKQNEANSLLYSTHKISYDEANRVCDARGE